MRYKTILIMMLSVLILCLPYTVEASNSKENTISKINDYLSESLKKNNINGASIAITKGDETYLTKGYGSFDHNAVTSDTPFPIASLSKSFTAMAIMQLVERRLIDLDASYLSYFPNIRTSDPRIKQITVRELLNHKSGLNDKVNPDMTRKNQFKSLDEINASLESVTLAANPGDKFSYHNPNYQFLARLVEQVSGEDFSEYLNNHIFKPLKMTNTYNVSSTKEFKKNEQLPTGNYLFFNKAIQKDEPYWFVNGPAGIVSTANDMAKWMKAQYEQSNTLLEYSSMKQFHQSPNSDPYGYGMGWSVMDEPDLGHHISHSGIFWTYKSEIEIYMEEEIGIAMMFNTGINSFINYSGILDGVYQIMNDENTSPSIFNSENMELVNIALIISTLAWLAISSFKMKKNKKQLNRKIVSSLIIIVILSLIGIFLPTTIAFFTGGRAVPLIGMWTTLPSLIILYSVFYIASVVRIFALVISYRKVVNR